MALKAEYTATRWWKAVIRAGDEWALVEVRGSSVEDMRLRLRKLVHGGVKICNIEEV